ncbi:MAG: sulfatase-like hydrolase/transferase [Candidatus Hydrogenedentota bacterium]
MERYWDRRDFLKTAGAGTVGALAAASLGNREAQAAVKPNILFIMLDDLGKDWVSCYGGEIETPKVDQLAAEGMRFKNAYSTPQCTPTRLQLLTGQYPFRHGWVNHWDVPRWGHAYFDWEEYPSLGRVMQSAGYATAIAGKWQVNDFRVQPRALEKHGFDDWCVWTGFETGNPPSSERYWDPYLYTREGSQTYEGEFGPDMFTDFLIEFMREHREEPMFLYFPMCLPHTPFTATPLEPDAEGRMERHKAMVRYCDHLLGRLVEALEELGLRENTIIIWTTDNGSGVAGSIDGHDVDSGKGQTSEMGVCAPFIVNGPGIVPEGVVTDALTDFTDLMPTFAELAGAELPPDYTYDGESIAALLLGEAEDSPREWIMAMGGQNNARLTDAGVENEWWFRDRVLRDKRYKLYVGADRKAEKLFDLSSGPFEEKDILEEAGGEAREAMERLLQVAEGFPEQDNDPRYHPPQEAYVEVTAESQTWKKGQPD